MKTVTRQTAIPEKSIIANGFDSIDYFDTYRIVCSTSGSVEEITAQIFKRNLPKWAKWLMYIRASIVWIFGLKSGRKMMREEQSAIFPVIEQNENEIVSGINDKHLDFRVSVLIDRKNAFIYLTTIVHFNNFWGRMYFLPIKPFHNMIIKSMLRKDAKTLQIST